MLVSKAPASTPRLTDGMETKLAKEPPAIWGASLSSKYPNSTKSVLIRAAPFSSTSRLEKPTKVFAALIVTVVAEETRVVTASVISVYFIKK